MLSNIDNKIQGILKKQGNYPLEAEDFAKIKDKRGLLKAITHSNYGEKYIIKFYYKAVQKNKIALTSQFDDPDLGYDVDLIFNGNWKKDRDRV